MNELFKMDFVHYIDINSHTLPHLLLFADYIRRCDETHKRILYCEDMFKKYEVEMIAPADLTAMEKVMSKI
jgi:hypothetical protein